MRGRKPINGPTHQMSQVEAAWLGGVIDCDGYVGRRSYMWEGRRYFGRWWIKVSAFSVPEIAETCLRITGTGTLKPYLHREHVALVWVLAAEEQVFQVLEQLRCYSIKAQKALVGEDPAIPMPRSGGQVYGRPRKTSN